MTKKQLDEGNKIISRIKDIDSQIGLNKRMRSEFVEDKYYDDREIYITMPNRSGTLRICGNDAVRILDFIEKTLQLRKVGLEQDLEEL
jgi:hypothetical protein